MKILEIFYFAETTTGRAIVELDTTEITFAIVENEQIIKTFPPEQALGVARLWLNYPHKMINPQNATFYPKLARAYYKAVGLPSS